MKLSPFSIILCVLQFFFTTVAEAQNERPQKETLQNHQRSKKTNNSKTELRAFGGLISEFSVLPEKPAAAAGIGAAFLLKRGFIGVYGLAQQHNNYIRRPGNNWYDAAFTHGGLWFGYIHKPEKLLHLNINGKIGAGNIALGKWKNQGNFPFNDRNRAIISDDVLVITPQIDLELNILEWMKLGFGFGYRVVSGIDYIGYQKSDFNTPVLAFNLLFGTF